MRDTLKTIGLVIALIVLGLIFLGLQYSRGNSIDLNMEARAHQAVVRQGYTDIVPTGYEYWACGNNAQGYNFQATNTAGMRVNLTACTDNGWFGINKSWWIVTR